MGAVTGYVRVDGMSRGTKKGVGIVPWTMVVAWLATASTIRAECVYSRSADETAGQVMADTRYELVFGGTVVAITRTAELGYRATFDVDRVWKGTASKRFDLYVWELVYGIPRFEVGHPYVALARKLATAEERKGAGVGETEGVVFTPVQCSDGPSVNPDLRRALGPGYEPHVGADVTPPRDVGTRQRRLGVPPSCDAELKRKAERISGEVVRGGRFERSTPSGWILRLVPDERGWVLVVTVEGRETEDLASMTPPWSGPRDLHIEGWHFRNADNTGPNDGSVNQPQELREFIFSPEVGREIQHDRRLTTADDVARVRAFGRGWLFIESVRAHTPAIRRICSV